MSLVFDLLKTPKQKEKLIERSKLMISEPKARLFSSPPNVIFVLLAVFLIALLGGLVFFGTSHFDKMDATLDSQKNILNDISEQLKEASQKLKIAEEQNQLVTKKLEQFSKELEQAKNERNRFFTEQKNILERNTKSILAQDERFRILSGRLDSLQKKLEDQAPRPEVSAT